MKMVETRSKIQVRRWTWSKSVVFCLSLVIVACLTGDEGKANFNVRTMVRYARQKADRRTKYGRV
jgi:hypothetical protein